MGREETGNCRFSAARRAPQDVRGQPSRCNHAAENAVLAQQMILADNLVQLSGAHALGKRSRCIFLE